VITLDARSRERGEPSISDAVACTGGIAVAFGLFLLSGDWYSNHPGRGAQFAIFAGLVLAGYLVLSLLPRVVHPAGVTAVVIGIPAALGWWLLPESERFADVRPFLGLTVLAFALCFIVPRTRARVVFVGLITVILWLWAIGEVADLDAYSAAPIPSPPPNSIFSLAAFTGQATVTLDDLDPTDPLYPVAEACDAGSMLACDQLYDEALFGSDFREFGAACGNAVVAVAGDCFGASFGPPDTDSGFDPGFDPDSFEPATPPVFVPGLPPDLADGGEGDDKSLEIGLVSLAFGLLYVAALWMLDRRGWRGLATAFVVSGAGAMFTGTTVLGNAADHAWVGGLLTFAAGILFGVVGHLGGRRFTAWTGGLMAAIGVVTVALDASDLSGSISDGDVDLVQPGLIVIGAGIALVAVAYLLAMILTDPSAGPVPAGGGGAPLPGGDPPGSQLSSWAGWAPPQEGAEGAGAAGDVGRQLPPLAAAPQPPPASWPPPSAPREEA
jgi:hypothetical protein